MQILYGSPNIIGKLSDDHEGRCGNCHAFLNGDSYCRFCGTKAGEGRYEPYNDDVGTIYGPPPRRRKFTCSKCGYIFKDWTMRDEIGYCPECGCSVTVTEDK